MECQNTFLFKAQYADGTVYEQGLDDKSRFVPGQNAYHDIFYTPFKPLSDLVGFHLVPADGSDGPVYSVGLVDGSFIINGVKVFPYQTTATDKNGKLYPLILSNFRLIYWRLTNVKVNAKGAADGGFSQTVQGMEVGGYIIGFQANDQFGNNHEHIIRVAG